MILNWRVISGIVVLAYSTRSIAHDSQTTFTSDIGIGTSIPVTVNEKILLLDDLVLHSGTSPGPIKEYPNYFKHDHLSDGDSLFRLLSVDGRDSETGHISCSLNTVSLNDVEGQFIAVSHTWGTDEHTWEILINQAIFFISPQLWQFLDLVADRIPGQQLWIDALCIAQDNNHEKELQIPLMKRIYSSAEKVIAYLDSPIDFKSNDLRYSSAINTNSVLDLIGAGYHFSLPLVRLVFHQYWSRVWIVQELRLSQSKEFWWEGQIIASERMGNIAYDLMAFIEGHPSRLYHELWTKIRHDTPPPAKKQSGSLLDHVDCSTILRWHKHCKFASANQDGNRDLIELILRYRNAHCSVREDRVYAMLGLVRKELAIPVQYNISAVSLLWNIRMVTPDMSPWEIEEIGNILGVQWSSWDQFLLNS